MLGLKSDNHGQTKQGDVSRGSQGLPSNCRQGDYHRKTMYHGFAMIVVKAASGNNKRLVKGCGSLLISYVICVCDKIWSFVITCVSL